MILDMREKQNSKTQVTINNSFVAVVSSYKYLGVIIQDNLKWNEHVEAQTNKAHKRMYNVRHLKKLKIDSKILCRGCGPVVRLLGCHARARRSLPSHCREVPSHVALP